MWYSEHILQSPVNIVHTHLWRSRLCLHTSLVPSGPRTSAGIEFMNLCISRELHLQICLVQFIQHQQKPKVDAAKILIQACCTASQINCWMIFNKFITMLLGYPSLLYGIPDKLLNDIQQIHNYTARVVIRLHKFNHITPALATLHWLHVDRLVDFKIALMVYKALNGQAQLISQISCSPTIHPVSSTRPTSSSSHSCPVVWKLMLTVHSAVQPQLYGTIFLVVWRLPKLKLKIRFYSVTLA